MSGGWETDGWIGLSVVAESTLSERAKRKRQGKSSGRAAAPLRGGSGGSAPDQDASEVRCFYREENLVQDHLSILPEELEVGGRRWRSG